MKNFKIFKNLLDYVNESELKNYNEEELEKMEQTVENFNSDECKGLQAYLENGNKLRDAIENAECGNYRIYYHCYSMEEVAREVAKDYLESLEKSNRNLEFLVRHFDYKSFGKELNLSGNYQTLDDCIVEIYY